MNFTKSTLNDKLRGKQISKRLMFGNGTPRFRWTPRVMKWRSSVNLFWLGVELIYLRGKV